MPRGKKFTAEQIAGNLGEAEVELARGKTVPDVVRKRGMAVQAYYRFPDLPQVQYRVGDAPDGTTCIHGQLHLAGQAAAVDLARAVRSIR